MQACVIAGHPVGATPDDRLREAIQGPREKSVVRLWIASSLALLAMTRRRQMFATHHVR